MSALLWVTLAALAIVVLAVAAVAWAGLRATFRPVDLRVRDGTLRGALAAGLARRLVGEAAPFRLPLLLVLEKDGPFGGWTRLPGTVEVEAIDWRILADGEPISTVRETAPVRIGALQRRLELAVDAKVEPPGGLLAAYAEFRRARRASREVRIDVRGVVAVRMWGLTRRVPVDVTRFVVLGEPAPDVGALDWKPGDRNHAKLRVTVVNPYREDELSGVLTVEVQRVRRLARDPVLLSHTEPIRLTPGSRHTARFEVAVGRGAGGAGADGHEGAHPIAVRAAVLWDGMELGTDSRGQTRLAPDETLRGGPDAPSVFGWWRRLGG